MPSNVSIGIVGSGFGKRIQEPAFHSIAGVSVKTCSSRSNSWERLLDDSGIHAICVSSPPFLHQDIVLRALAAGKHVLCEKPFGLDFSAAQTMLNASSEGLICAVDFEYRYHCAFRAVKREIELGSIGQIQAISVTWHTAGRVSPELPWSWQYDRSLGGGSVDAFASHVIDYIQWLTGKSFSLTRAENRILVPLRSGVPVTAEDTSSFHGSLGGGVEVDVSVSNVDPNGTGHRFQIIGNQGTIVYHLRPPFTLDALECYLKIRGDLAPISILEPSQDHSENLLIRDFRELAIDWIGAIRGQSIPVGRLPSFREGAEIRKILDQIKTA